MDRKPRVQKIFEGDGDPRHGTANGYGYLGCRCPDCTAANTVDHAQRQAQPRPSLAPDDERHGSSTAYRYWSCRCVLCREKNAEDSRIYWQARHQSA